MTIPCRFDDVCKAICDKVGCDHTCNTSPDRKLCMRLAEVAIADVINGTALYKPIPLPSGTPIDLTLDTSLNFDELLKSYAEAWSKSLSPEGHPDNPPGAKP